MCIKFTLHSPYVYIIYHISVYVFACLLALGSKPTLRLEYITLAFVCAFAFAFLYITLQYITFHDIPIPCRSHVVCITLHVRMRVHVHLHLVSLRLYFLMPVHLHTCAFTCTLCYTPVAFSYFVNILFHWHCINMTLTLNTLTLHFHLICV